MITGLQMIQMMVYGVKHIYPSLYCDSCTAIACDRVLLSKKPVSVKKKKVIEKTTSLIHSLSSHYNHVELFDDFGKVVPGFNIIKLFHWYLWWWWFSFVLAFKILIYNMLQISEIKLPSKYRCFSWRLWGRKTFGKSCFRVMNNLSGVSALLSYRFCLAGSGVRWKYFSFCSWQPQMCVHM